MTFFIQVNDDPTYSNIMEFISSRSMTFSKDGGYSGYATLEVSGTLDDYKVLKSLIEKRNEERDKIVATIQEGI